jgi:hypothetical protein
MSGVLPRRNPADVHLEGDGRPSPAAEGAADRGERAGGRVLRTFHGDGARVDTAHSGHIEQLFGEQDRSVDPRDLRIGRAEDPFEETRW